MGGEEKGKRERVCVKGKKEEIKGSPFSLKGWTN